MIFQKKTLLLVGIFFFIFILESFAYVSVNVPINHWSYETIDKLIGRGLIKSALVGTRPFTRLEMARLVGEALSNHEEGKTKNRITTHLLTRLKKEFRDELIELKYIKGASAHSFFKPLEDPYLRFVYGDKRFELENRQGDVFSPFANYRLGFSTRAKLWDHFSLYLHPELRYQKYGEECEIDDEEWEVDPKVIEGYLKLDIMNLEIELGRDSLWWGPGRHGSLLLSNNAEAFDMIKISNPRSILLPWLFRYLGPFKATIFYTELERDRLVPEAELAGIRLNFKPRPILEIGFSRTIVFGGEEREGYSLSDWGKVFRGFGEHEGGEYDNNQFIGMDISLTIPEVDRLIPLAKTITLYADIGADDTRFGRPHHYGCIVGIYLGDIFLTGRTDLRFEYASNKLEGFVRWYIHRYGYTYEGRIFGHHMGADADDLFIELTHYLTEDLLLRLAYDRQEHRWKYLTNMTRGTKTYGELGLSFLGFGNFELRGVYRYEHTKNLESNPGDTEENNIIILETVYDF